MSDHTDKTLERMEAKIDRMDDRLGAIDRGQERHSAILEEHQRRSIALEEQVEILRGEIEPIKASALAWGYLGKVIAGLGAVAGIVTAVMKLTGHWQ